MESLEWILDGIGTEIISLLIGAAFGGAAGYKIGSKNKIKQSQNAGNNSKQIQIGSVNYNGDKQAKSDRRR